MDSHGKATNSEGFDAIAREAAAVQVELEDDRGFPELDDDDVPF